MHDIICGIGRFDADHALPILGTHVRHAFGLFDPRIPDNGTFRAALFDSNSAIPNRVVEDASRLGAQVHLICFPADTDRVLAQQFALKSVSFVDVSGAFETGNRDLINVGDAEIAVQASS
jgi:hypothetical protein